MRLRLVAGYVALAAALGGACGGRVTDVGSPGEAVQDGGAPRSSAPDASATDDAGSNGCFECSPLDASATVDAPAAIEFDADCPLYDGGSNVVDLGDGATCNVPSQAAFTGTGCFVASPGSGGLCPPSDYVIVCGAAATCPLHLDAHCTPLDEVTVGGGACCPCSDSGAGAPPQWPAF
jgi:hypothetical protein